MRTLARSIAAVLAIAPSLGCRSLYDATIWSLETYGRLNPLYRCGMIDILPGNIYLPRTVLGQEPDFAIQHAEPEAPGESIGFVQDSQTRSAGVTETLRVEIWEGTAEHPIAYTLCFRGQGPPYLCKVFVTTPLGRRVFSHYLPLPVPGFVFAIDRTVIAVSVGSHVSTNPGHWNPVALSTGEVEAFVDSFVEAGAWELCWMPLRESQDVE